MKNTVKPQKGAGWPRTKKPQVEGYSIWSLRGVPMVFLWVTHISLSFIPWLFGLHWCFKILLLFAWAPDSTFTTPPPLLLFQAVRPTLFSSFFVRTWHPCDHGCSFSLQWWGSELQPRDWHVLALKLEVLVVKPGWPVFRPLYLVFRLSGASSLWPQQPLQSKQIDWNRCSTLSLGYPFWDEIEAIYFTEELRKVETKFSMPWKALGSSKVHFLTKTIRTTHVSQGPRPSAHISSLTFYYTVWCHSHNRAQPHSPTFNK